MYQIFTGEDWTKHLYEVTERDSGKKLGWIGAIFIIAWFAISSIVILNMFLSRIDDSLNLPDDKRRYLQVKRYFHKQSQSASDASSPTYRPLSKATSPTEIGADPNPDAYTKASTDKFLEHNSLWRQYPGTPAQSDEVENKHTLEIWLCLAFTKARIVWSAICSRISRGWSSTSLHPVTGGYRKLQKGCRILLNQDGHDQNRSRYTWKDSFMIFINMSIVMSMFVWLCTLGSRIRCKCRMLM